MEPTIKWVTYPELQDQHLVNVQRLCFSHFQVFWEAEIISSMNLGLTNISRDVAIAIIAYFDVKKEAHMTMEEVFYEAEKLFTYNVAIEAVEPKSTFKLRPIAKACIVQDGSHSVIVNAEILQELIKIAKDKGWFAKPTLPGAEREKALMVHADLR
jgi:hypothetical protein